MRTSDDWHRAEGVVRGIAMAMLLCACLEQLDMARPWVLFLLAFLSTVCENLARFLRPGWVK